VDAEEATPRGQDLASARHLRQEWRPMQLRKLQQRTKHIEPKYFSFFFKTARQRLAK
jgi:hypothetical protein